MRDFFMFRLDTFSEGKDNSTPVDVALIPPFIMRPILDGKEEIGTYIEMGPTVVKVKQIREQIYAMDKFGILKKTWGNQ